MSTRSSGSGGSSSSIKSVKSAGSSGSSGSGIFRGLLGKKSSNAAKGGEKPAPAPPQKPQRSGSSGATRRQRGSSAQGLSLPSISEMPPQAEAIRNGLSGNEGDPDAGGVTWETIEPPEEFVCPLSLEVMYDPVIVSSGQTYERAFITRWIREGHTTCPKTRQPLDAKAIYPNQVLKVMIIDWCKQNGVPLPTPRNPEASDSAFATILSGDGSNLPTPLRRNRQAAENAARAAAVALESERRQRALLERMAEERGNRQAPAASRRGSQPRGGGGSQRGSQRGSTELAPSWARDAAQVAAEASAAMANGSSRGDSISSLGSGGPEWSSDSVPAAGERLRGSQSAASSIAHSFNADQALAGWPGQLAMQSQVFRSLSQGTVDGGRTASGAFESPAPSAPNSGLFSGPDSRVFSSPGSQDSFSENLSSAPPSATATPSRSSAASLSRTQRERSMEKEVARALARDLRSVSISGENEHANAQFSSSSSFSVDSLDASDSQSVGTSVAELQMLDIQQLVHNVSSGAPEDQAASAALLRVMTRHGFKHSKKVYEADAAEPLIDLMLAEDEPTVEHAVTTILNLSLDDRLKTKIADKEGLIPNIVHVLSNGMPQARANAAAALYCLSTIDGKREAIKDAGAIPGLVAVLDEGTWLNKRDGANALVSLSMCKENRPAIAQSGVVALMCRLLRDGVDSVEEQTAAIFAALVRDPVGRQVLFDEGAIPALAELVEGGGTSRCREYSVNALLGLAVNSKEALAAIDEEGISASIDVLTRTGSTKTQAKATALLELLRQFDAAETEA